MCGVGLLLVVVGCCEVGSVLDVRRSTGVTSGKITKEFFLPREVSFFYWLLGENGWESGRPRVKICFSGHATLWFNGREHVVLNFRGIIPLSNINSGG